MNGKTIVQILMVVSGTIHILTGHYVAGNIWLVGSIIYGRD